MDTRDVLADAFGRVVGDVEAAIAGLDADGLAFRPDPDANSIGWLVWHLTRVQDDHIAALAGRDQAYVEAGFAERFGFDLDDADIGYGHSSDEVALVRPSDVSLLLEYLRAVHERTLAYVDTVDADELDRVVDDNWDPPVTAGVRIVSVIDDCIQHAGQASYVRGLLDRRD